MESSRQSAALILLLAVFAAASAVPFGDPYASAPASYKYGYAVRDDYSGVDFGHNEARDGYGTQGEYRVLLPDGRTQVVRYHVDDAYSGYVADVSYEGYAKHQAPAPKPAPYGPYRG